LWLRHLRRLRLRKGIAGAMKAAPKPPVAEGGPAVHESKSCGDTPRSIVFLTPPTPSNFVQTGYIGNKRSETWVTL
jgi:hypothetical protein